MQEQFEAVLSLFCDGEYSARLLRSVPREMRPRDEDGPSFPAPQYGLCERDFDFPTRPATNGFFDWERGMLSHQHEEYVVLMSQPISWIVESRLEYYKQQIKNGSRPIVFAACLHNRKDRIIVDGHHKFMAYLFFPEIEPAWLLVELLRGKAGFNFGFANGPYIRYCEQTREVHPKESLFILQDANFYARMLQERNSLIEVESSNDSQHPLSPK